MSCVVGRQALAAASLLICAAGSVSAKADPPMPAGQTGSGTGQQTSPDQKSTNSAPPPAPGAQQRVTRSVQQPVPAQQRYGAPRNPIVGGVVDTDLSKPLSIARAVQIALQQQDAIAIAQTQADAAENRVVEARSSYFPQVTPTFTYQQVRGPASTSVVTGVTPAGLPITTTVNGVFQSETRTDLIGARQLIFDTGLREANVGLARRTAFAAQYEVGNQRQTVIATVISDYYNVLRDQELVGVQQDNLKRAQTTLDSIQAQIQVGNAAKSDALQAEADVANAQVAVLSAQNDLRLANTTLKNAMGVVSPATPTLSDAHTPPPSATPDPKGVESYVQTAYFRRLDVLEQQERVNAQGYSVRIANINNGIQAEADITEGYQFDPSSGEERQFNVNITYPLFNGGNTRAMVREQKAQYESQKRTLDQLEQNVRLAVEQAYITREVARQRVVASQSAVAAGQTNYDAALEKQRNGVINILDVLTAENALVVAQENLVSAIYDFYTADAMLQRAIGLNDPQFVPSVPDFRKYGGPPPHARSRMSLPVAGAPAVPPAAIVPTISVTDPGGRKP